MFDELEKLANKYGFSCSIPTISMDSSSQLKINVELDKWIETEDDQVAVQRIWTKFDKAQTYKKLHCY